MAEFSEEAFRNLQQQNAQLQELVNRMQARGFGPRPRVGVVGVRDIVYGNKALGIKPREFKQVRNAMSVQGANAMVAKHNALYPNKPSAHWHVEYGDFNNDTINDLEIHNSKHDPLVVNGWTTKVSDWPTKHDYYTAYPTKEARKARRQALAEELGKDYEDVNTYKIERKRMLAQNTAANNAYRGAGYRYYKGEVTNAYQKFVTDVIKPLFDVYVKQSLVDGNKVIPNARGNWYDVGIISKCAARMYDEMVLRPLAPNGDTKNPAFMKWKKKEGKPQINAVVDDMAGRLTNNNDDFGFETSGVLQEYIEEELQRLQQPIQQ